MGVQNVPHRGRSLTWLAVRIPDLTVYTNFPCPRDSTPGYTYNEDITSAVHTTGEALCSLGFKQSENLLVFAGNTSERTVVTSVSIACDLQGSYRLRSYNSLLGRWVENDDLVPAEDLQHGLVITIERDGFCLLDLEQEV